MVGQTTILSPEWLLACIILFLMTSALALTAGVESKIKEKFECNFKYFGFVDLVRHAAERGYRRGKIAC